MTIVKIGKIFATKLRVDGMICKEVNTLKHDLKSRTVSSEMLKKYCLSKLLKVDNTWHR